MPNTCVRVFNTVDSSHVRQARQAQTDPDTTALFGWCHDQDNKHWQDADL